MVIATPNVDSLPLFANTLSPHCYLSMFDSPPKMYVFFLSMALRGLRESGVR